MEVSWQPGIIVDWNEGSLEDLEYMHWILNELSLAHWVVVVVSTQWFNESSFSIQHINSRLSSFKATIIPGCQLYGPKGFKVIFFSCRKIWFSSVCTVQWSRPYPSPPLNSQVIQKKSVSSFNMEKWIYYYDEGCVLNFIFPVEWSRKWNQ